MLVVPLTHAHAQAEERLFYYVDNEAAYNSLVKHIDQITILGPQVYSVDSLGIVWGSLDPRVKAVIGGTGPSGIRAVDGSTAFSIAPSRRRTT